MLVSVGESRWSSASALAAVNRIAPWQRGDIYRRARGMGEHPGEADFAHGGSPLHNRWAQLAAGTAAMMAVANFQYAWTLFIPPLVSERGWDGAQVANALAIYFTPAQTWLVPFAGYLAERFGPRRLMIAGGAMAGVAWIVNAQTTSLAVLNAAQLFSGCGSGIVYSISVGNALKWFPDRRGLAAGLTAAAFPLGWAASVYPMTWVIDNLGYSTAFVWFGSGQAIVIIVSSCFMRFPRLPSRASPASNVAPARRDYTPREVLVHPLFWLLYVMMTLGALPGLLMLVQIKPMARDYGIDQVPLSLFGASLGTALHAALVLEGIMGGLTRPIFGWLSDRIGRETAMFLAFGLEGTALWILIQAPANPLLFVIMCGVAFFGWGAIFSLFPAMSGDLFGSRFAVTNYGLLYTAKGAASLLVALCNRMQADTGSWELVFALMITADWVAALLALCVLRPLRRWHSVGRDSP
jgi:MFS transporter, OFA family, oxalate/formate antiporter